MSGAAPAVRRSARIRRLEARGLAAERLTFGALAIVLLSATLWGCARGSDWVEIRGQRVDVEVVVTRADQARGLGYRDGLDWHHGMLFVYEEADFYAFWMKGMRFDIDIVFIRDGRIVDLHPHVPHPKGDEQPATVRTAELADSVLEVPAGYAQAHAWRLGDRVEVHRQEAR